MRTGKVLIAATREFMAEDRLRSWSELLVTMVMAAFFFGLTLATALPWVARSISSVVCGLMYVRLFVIYHDYQHHAILQHSRLARWLMKSIGIYLLAPQTIWKRSHDHHHNNNSKLTITGIGSYPTITRDRYLQLTRNEKRIYLMNRHPVTILLGYFTLFIYWLNLKSFAQSPGRHLDSLVALIFHFGFGGIIVYTMGWLSFLLAWFLPFLLAFGMGSYLFYCQHNFPEAQFRENQDWQYEHAALSSTSFMIMNPLLQWFTGNIGYHHVHHLNSRIPFYRLVEAMDKMPELKLVHTTSWNPLDMFRCFNLKLWDPSLQKMITLQELKRPVSARTQTPK